MDLPKKICFAPWTAMTVAATGGVKPCCVFLSKSYPQSHLKDDDFIKTAWDSWVPLRKFMITHQQLPDPCKVCETRESVLGTSRLKWYDQLYINSDMSEVNLASASPEVKLFHMDFNFSNKCNLKCRMCGSWGSTAWFKDEALLDSISKKMPNDPYKRGASVSNLTPNFNDVDQLINLMDNKPEYFSNLVRLDFKGGEPLMHEEMFVFLEYLIKKKLSKNINIAYTTNGTKTPNILKELWPHFKKIILNVSMDGTDGVYEYIRGGNIITLDELENNLHFFNSFENLQGSFNTTISIYNIFNLTNIMDWINSLKRKNVDRFLSNAQNQKFDCMVTNPSYLSIENMPPELKFLAREKLNKYPYSNLDTIKSSLEITEYDKSSWSTFIDFTKDLDKIRDTDVTHVIPELIPYFK